MSGLKGRAEADTQLVMEEKFVDSQRAPSDLTRTGFGGREFGPGRRYGKARSQSRVDTFESPDKRLECELDDGVREKEEASSASQGAT
ncbi:uncharacterized protein N7459_001293 [Penicillium hispanicum]|uniref:uncharacterized protein n=1 Tax=Penicillium hispanicum TaxID=1080232 RepID=UPI002540D353|nr:uncharacterized protein N7459_001293 [Penicillium hispanicum]KAJ5595085.1 hypothetical protein N7459_001293 [Penicillium hispanicum]